MSVSGLALGGSRSILVKWMGRMSYTKGLQLQEQLAAAHIKHSDKNQDVLILCEHNPVYTLGRRLQVNEYEEKRLIGLGAEYVKTLRGGQITFHGPGQLVGYPILNLAHYKKSVKWYIRAIENMLIETCGKYNLQAQTTEDTGVWIGNKKVAAIGVSLSRLITQHGFALNCNTDLNWFNHIVPCGLVGKGVTSLSKETRRLVTAEAVIPNLVKAFGKHFDAEMIMDPNAMVESESWNKGSGNFKTGKTSQC